MLILTSYGFRSPIVSEKLKNIIDPKGKTVLIVPFAGFNNESCARRETEGLIEFGFAADSIFVYDKEVPENNKRADYIFVPGGNTFKLLYEARQCGALEVIGRMVEEGSAYIGASAGAELATTNIEYVTMLEDNNYELESFDALGFIDDVVIPHSDQREIPQLLKANRLAEPKRMPACIGNGSVFVYERNEWGRFTYADCIIN